MSKQVDLKGMIVYVYEDGEGLQVEIHSNSVDSHLKDDLGMAKLSITLNGEEVYTNV